MRRAQVFDSLEKKAAQTPMTLGYTASWVKKTGN
jgi:hypothetical protein